MAAALEPTLGLPAPFSASPGRPPKHVVRFENPSTGLFYVTNFCELYAAKYPVSLIIDDREWKWRDDKTIVCTDGLIVHSDDLEEIVEYKLTPKERQWVPPSPYYGQWHNIAAGQPLDARRSGPAQASNTDDSAKPTSKREKRPTPVPDVTEGAKKAPRPSKDGLVSVAEVAVSLGKDAKACRIALRKSNTPKPDAGWAWPADELEAIKAVILKHIK
jgi:hypothetical protein